MNGGSDTTLARPSCSQDEDTDHHLLLCPQAREVFGYFNPDFSARGPSNLADLWTSHCQMKEHISFYI
jgi:hypothetical protein